jgi:hypothetical protein
VAFTLRSGTLNCSGGTVEYTQSVNVSQATPTVATTNTTTFKALATQNYSWEAVFTPDAATLAKGVSGDTHCENSELIVRNNP